MAMSQEKMRAADEDVGEETEREKSKKQVNIFLASWPGKELHILWDHVGPVP